MKGALRILRAHGGRAMIFLTGSTLAQALSAVSGLLLARWLSVPDYALFTVMMTLTGAMTVLTKGGAHLGYTAILGRVWPDMSRVAEAVQAVLRMRRLVSAVVLPAVLIGALWLLRNNGADVSETTLLLLLLVLLWWADMRTRLVDQVLFFAHQTTRVQLLDMALALVRLTVILALYALGWLTVETAVAAAVLVSLLRVRPILHWVGRLADLPRAQPRAEDTAEIRGTVKRQLPIEVYYVFQAQIVLFAISAFGSVENLAGYGALTRFNQLMAPIEAFTFAFCVPIFARATERIGLTLAAMVLLTSLPGFALFALSLTVPEALLWLVGDNYAELTRELAMMAALVTLTRAAGTFWSLIAHRGWVRFSWIQVPLGLAWCLAAPLWIDFSTLGGAMLLQAGFPLALAGAAFLELMISARRECK